MTSSFSDTEARIVDVMARSHIFGVAGTVQNESQKHASRLTGVLAHTVREAVASFFQARSGAHKVVDNKMEHHINAHMLWISIYIYGRVPYNPWH